MTDAARAAPVIAVEPTTCGLCGSARAHPYTVSRDYEYGTCANEWRFVQCLD